MPNRPGMAGEMFGRVVAEALHRVTPFQQGQAFGDKALKFNRADFRAVLLTLAALLRLLVSVKQPLDALTRAMKHVDDRPEQILEIGLKTGVLQRHDNASKLSATASCNQPRLGSGLGSASSSKGR